MDLVALGRRLQEIIGEEKSCKRKKIYDTLVKVQEAVKSHNSWPERNHDVYYYRCIFCDKFHLGRLDMKTFIHMDKYQKKREIEAFKRKSK